MLDAAVIEEAVRGTRVPFAVTCFDEIESTNEEIKRLIASGAAEGTVVTSIVQTGGYGRQGRRWASPAGSLYLSVLLRPLGHGVAQGSLPTLSLVVALAVRETLRAYGARGVCVKWPNDVLCDQGKLCGISLEALDRSVCIGIGINVFAPDEFPPTTGAFQPAYLERVGDLGAFGKRVLSEPEALRNEVLETLAAHLLAALDRCYARWLAEGFEAFTSEYHDCAFLNGRSVGISSMSGDIVASGRVVRVDERGNLVLLDEHGREHCIASGEAHVVL
ncbi:biotin--[acetyl-CoA-carboxylase] ligase [Raoultibacter phocaeensis]|uniref:biotin--[acetyl-CoA-carboxylase] ligase n=1 Tax=Raoultibacter phocaeensis TaxID=2479841 RepID=UPI001118DF2F|nr:biotin--[acetyl-CoA-carboxylase] ligase [Raoultibacter phocaeensis]